MPKLYFLLLFILVSVLILAFSYYPVTYQVNIEDEYVETLEGIEQEENGLIVEAEESFIEDLEVERSLTGYSGEGYVSGFTNDAGSITFEFEVPAKGLYHLLISYATPSGYKKSNLLLNGKKHGEVEFKNATGFSKASAGKVLLKEGKNSITLEKGWGWYYIDFINLTLSSAASKHEATKNLINPNATVEARALISYLVDQFGKSILSGQQEYPNSELKDTLYIQSNTGKLPAVLGLDFLDNSPSRVENGTTADEVQVAIDWWNNGGIVAFTWHWNAPKDLINTEDNPWWRGFYTDGTTFDLDYALDHPASEDYQLLLRDMDVIAEELKKLQEANVPVLWRPLHEAEGGWFWWGAKGPESTIELWKLMYDRMTNHHELNNLIWVWNSVSEDWYPGDEFVDIVSYYSYPGAFDYGPVSNQYESLIKLSSNKKVIALGENGPIPNPDLLPEYQANWSWFMTWDGEVLREQNSIEYLKKVYNHDNVITLDELPDLRTYLDEND